MIHLINLPQPNSLDDRLDPPYGLMSIAGVLRSQGKEVKIIELSSIPESDWESSIGYADIYGMTVFSSSLHIAKKVRDICRKISHRSVVIVGGPHPTSLPEECAKEFDYVCVGEGEYFFDTDLTQSDQIVGMPQIEDLNALPFPARDLVDIHSYHRKVQGRPATTLITARGCPYRCAFCYQDMFGNRIRSLSTERIVAEVKQVIGDFGINAFIIYDDTFALNRKRFYEVCAEFKKLDIVFRCNGDARHNTLEDFKILYEAGCREIEFGIESGSQVVLDKIHKNVTVEQNTQAVKNAQKAGLIVKSFLMVGNPGETRETIEETKNWILEADPDQYTLFTFIPLPGCAIWKNPAKYGIKITSKDFKEYFSIAGNYEAGMVVDTEELTAIEIEEEKRKLLKFLGERKQRGKLQDYYAKKGD